MTPEERALIDGLFERMRGAADQPRDGEAEALIARRVAEMPYAPYAFAQTVLVQDHALQQAAARIEDLETELRAAQARAAAPAAPPAAAPSFLGGLLGGRGTSVPTTGGRSATGAVPGAGGPMALPPQPQGQPSPFGQQAPYPPQQGYPQQGYAQPQQSGPWGQQGRGFGGGMGGGGFLQGALTTAAGVAGGMLLANGIRDLMSGGTGPVAEQAALEMPKADAAAGDLGSQAQDALGGAPDTNVADAGGDAGSDAGSDPWGAAPQDASYDPGTDTGGWDAGGDSDFGGGDDSSWA
ncbi:MAG: hypothetical protein B7Z15_08330 [Rhizobiales bacterium 32-66-8]|nr:MAG: hypothetical protein B7Z15_08330 [Rhizobiales bacterium 32-66-8]